MDKKKICFFFCFLSPLFAGVLTAAQSLYTDSGFIVDETGQRIKLSCVSWPAHLEAVVAEGLSKRPLNEISIEIIRFGFNCVRLTWPLFLFTNDTLASMSVRQSFKNLGLVETIADFQTHNPSIIDLSLINAYKAVVLSLAEANVLIILDNHLSKPGWCCNTFDDDGFFGDMYFDPDLWLKGLTNVATIFNDNQYVVGMSLRNELRGLRQNVKDWYRYMQKGAEVVHAANRNVLVILSGLAFDTDLSFLLNKPVKLSFSNKAVFEMHWYAWDGHAWSDGNLNQLCGQKIIEIGKKAGFLLGKGYPLILSEFGFDMTGTNVNDNRYLNCLMGWAAESDIDWALWTLGGSYYLREGVIGHDETYGVYKRDWCGIRNQTMLQKISALQYPFTGPGYTEALPHNLLFHPMKGLCVKRLPFFDPLVLGLCSEAAAWKYTPQGSLTINGTDLCLQADQLGKPAKLGRFCTKNNSKWKVISDSKMHLSSKLKNGNSVCLDIDSNNTIITSKCKCLDKASKCDPASQWFKIIYSTRNVGNL